jgi:hypothetical protein
MVSSLYFNFKLLKNFMIPNGSTQLLQKILQQGLSDRIFFRSVNARGYPAGMGAGNAGMPCTVRRGHQEIEDLEKVRSF